MRFRWPFARRSVLDKAVGLLARYRTELEHERLDSNRFQAHVRALSDLLTTAYEHNANVTKLIGLLYRRIGPIRFKPHDVAGPAGKVTMAVDKVDPSRLVVHVHFPERGGYVSVPVEEKVIADGTLKVPEQPTV